ncbi:hypothetical protein G8764_07845 [Pseudomaricurvus alcaniphilus]|uniref:hypothetical protein n=1 Tax=Pseudomaricurvus alcaniphilus TaxID=1166482 RepID=UPI0014088E63|nr:hypothetical protein [Pseudomaricurvus alcaniphilus]NHN37198.1 hypothetical protein [Pseudomaricurvus alcaniphilus]
MDNNELGVRPFICHVSEEHEAKLKTNMLDDRHAPTILTPVDRDTVWSIIEVWRQRVQSLSWFMKLLNEPIARMVNAEDHCTGHFWESRFKSQALLTEEALISCMAYVDLNPIRAGMARTPESSDHTSVKERIQPAFKLAEAIKDQNLTAKFNLPIKPLLGFEDTVKSETQTGTPLSLSDYLQLVDWTGRAIRDGKQALFQTDCHRFLPG